MAGNVRFAQGRGELPSELQPEEVAFEVDAILVGADVNFVFFNDPLCQARGKQAVGRLLGVAASRVAG